MREIIWKKTKPISIWTKTHKNARQNATTARMTKNFFRYIIDHFNVSDMTMVKVFPLQLFTNPWDHLNNSLDVRQKKRENIEL